MFESAFMRFDPAGALYAHSRDGKVMAIRVGRRAAAQPRDCASERGAVEIHLET